MKYVKEKQIFINNLEVFVEPLKSTNPKKRRNLLNITNHMTPRKGWLFNILAGSDGKISISAENHKGPFLHSF